MYVTLVSSLLRRKERGRNVCVCVYVFMYIWTWWGSTVCVCVCMYLCLYVHGEEALYVCVCVYLYVYMYMVNLCRIDTLYKHCIHIHTRKTQKNTHMHTHTHHNEDRNTDQIQSRYDDLPTKLTWHHYIRICTYTLYVYSHTRTRAHIRTIMRIGMLIRIDNRYDDLPTKLTPCMLRYATKQQMAALPNQAVNGLTWPS
jgi:hypothetical protein